MKKQYIKAAICCVSADMNGFVCTSGDEGSVVITPTDITDKGGIWVANGKGAYDVNFEDDLDSDSEQ